MPQLSSQDKNELENHQELIYTADTADKLKLWKGSSFAPIVIQDFSHRQSTLAVEGLFIFNLKADANNKDQQMKIYRSLSSFSTMKGLQVYSESLKRMETFIFDAYPVSRLSKDAKIHDPVITNIPEKLTFPLYQNEEQTGESFSQITLERIPVGFKLTQRNLTNLNYGIIPLVSPGDLFTSITVVPMGSSLLVYGISTAKTLRLFGLEKTKINSLVNRMKSLVIWFDQNLRKEN